MSLIFATALLGTMTYGATVPASVSVERSAYTQTAEDSLSIPADPAPPLPIADRRFMVRIAQDNLAAIAALQTLAERSQDDALRRFAGHALDDRQALQQALEVLAIQKDVTLPRQPSRMAEAALGTLDGTQSGPEFDKAWLQRYGRLPQQTAARFSAEQQRLLQNPDVRAFALSQSIMLRRQAEVASRIVSACACVEESARPALTATTAAGASNHSR